MRWNRWLEWSFITSLLILSISWLRVEANQFPSLNPHPLPPSLADWLIQPEVGDYFSEIKNVPLAEYLIWSQFPVQVYVESGPENWLKAINTAIAQWNQYIPLQQILEPEQADIIIQNQSPPLVTTRDPATGQLKITRARAGITQYQFYVKDQILYHRMVISIKSGQSYPALLGTILHELGHALGIWGHSPYSRDILYFSSIGQVATISPRDLNTLKKIYQQPTRLGWKLS